MTRDTVAKSCVVQADVSQPGDIKRLVATIEQQFGMIDILVNNAGICPVRRKAPFVFMAKF